MKQHGYLIALLVFISSLAVANDENSISQKIRSVQSQLHATYPQVILSDRLSYFDPQLAKKGLTLYSVIEQIIRQKSLRTDISEIQVVTNELGGIKTLSTGKLVAIMNLHEATRSGQWEIRLSTSINTGNTCEAAPENLQSLRQYLDFIKSLPHPKMDTPAEWHTLYAIDLSSESPLVVQLLKKLLAIEPLLRKEKFLGQIYSPKILEKARGCKNLNCVLEKIYDTEELGLLQLKILHKYGMNPSYAQDPDEYYNWNLQILKIVEASLREASSLIFDVITKKNLSDPENPMKLVLSKRSPMVGPFKVLANASMTFFYEFTRLPLTDLKGFMMHELAHHLYEPLAGNPRYREGWPSWQNLSGWKFNDLKDVGWSHNITYKNFVSEYAGNTNPEEDFAESVRVYRYEPVLLKQISNDKYEFIKHMVFDGIEYLDETTCVKQGLTTQLSSTVTETALTKIKTNAIAQCSTHFVQYQIYNTEPSQEIFSQLTNASLQVKQNITSLKKETFGLALEFKNCFSNSVSASLQAHVNTLNLPKKYSLDWMRGYQLHMQGKLELESESLKLEKLYLNFKSSLLQKIHQTLPKWKELCKQGSHISTTKLTPFIEALGLDVGIKTQILGSYGFQNAISKAVVDRCGR